LLFQRLANYGTYCSSDRQEENLVDFRALSAVAVLFALIAAGPARAADCPGNPNAIGTSRTLYIDPIEHIRLGMMQYPESLPLADHEVVLTFDDGPLPPHTGHVLQTLASECVKATFFLVGRQANAYPEWVRKIHEAGHTIGTHSQNHPLRFNHMTTEQIDQEVEGGITSVAAALGDRAEIAPFFRIPGLLRSDTVERYLASKSLMSWSADFPADDWLRRISSKEIAARALRRIEARGRGMLLLHDIKPATAVALPIILHELKKRGYHIVHVVPASAEHPKTVTRIADWASRKHKAPSSTVAWPQPSLTIETLLAEPTLPVPDPQNLGLDLAGMLRRPASLPRSKLSASAYDEPPADPSWPPVVTVPSDVANARAATLPVPELKTFGIGRNATPIFAVSVNKRYTVGRGASHHRAATRAPQQTGKVATSHHPRRATPRPVANAGTRHVHVARKPPGAS
jgi:peptidoglycan/xylan/chitin deacetylase (PgdA/CDA1 family)